MAALLRDLDQAFRFERAQVVVDLLARKADPRGETRGAAGRGQLGQQPGPDRVQRDGRDGRFFDHCDVPHGAIEALTRIFVKVRWAP